MSVQQGTSKILILRLSALGDVAMTIPVIWSLKQQFPSLEITFVSREFARPLIEKIPGVQFVPFEVNSRHKGFLGIFRLFRDLKKLKRFDFVADLHDVLRTKILRFLFRSSGCKVAFIDKGRSDKKLLTRKNNKIFIPLSPTVVRYANVFHSLGFDVKIDFKSVFPNPAPIHPDILLFTGPKQGKWIGIAPFAKHEGKAYPIDKMKYVIKILSEKPGNKIFLFGGGKFETTALESISSEYDSVVNLAGKMKLERELEVISNLNLMVSMDSANMHLASLTGIPVVSVWGATHPFAGFYGWNQEPENAVQIELDCRPCSVFGNKPCFRKDYACMNWIEPQMIADRALKILQNK